MSRHSDPLTAADALAERLVKAVTAGTPTDGDAAIARDARNAKALAQVAATLALVSMARDVRRALDLADQFYFIEDDDQ